MHPCEHHDLSRRAEWSVPVTVPDLSYWKLMIECQAACPVHTDARGYIQAIAAGDYERAYLIARGPNPLASLCGRVCGAPCETACRRGDVDRPLAIRALKRFVCERFGPEANANGRPDLIEFLKEAAARAGHLECEGIDELLPLLQAVTSGAVPPLNSPSVGIIGAGPAGLAAAHDLALLGARVTIYEMESSLAGMLAVGVPQYRLPREVIAAEVAVITALGVEAVTNCRIGRDKPFAELRERHEAVVIAVGLKNSRGLDIPGIDAQGVLGGVEYLRDVAIGNPPPLGRRVVVIGGGSVAYDVGRTTLRQISMDAARTALRADDVVEVHLCSLESLEEMPAEDTEIIEGDEEGVIRHNSLGPVEVLTRDGRVAGVVFRKCLRVYDDDGRFSPVFDDTVRQTIECDNVLLAVGQRVDLSFLQDGGEDLKRTERGLIACDPETGRTSSRDVYVAGDLAYGPKLLIHAVASGKAVARAIYEDLTGRPIRAEDTELHLALPGYQRDPGYEVRRRTPIPTLAPSERLVSQSAEVERGYTEELARLEASRCLDCGVNTVFDGDRCIVCGGCADVCPELCLWIVSADRVAADHSGGDEIIAAQLGEHVPGEATAIVKDETACIRCGLCADRCPTGAITMTRFLFREAPSCAASA